MARYKKIHVRMYGDAKFRSLSRPQPNGQSLWIYLLTGPHTTTIPGLSTIGEAAIAESLEWPLKGFREAFREVSAKGLVEADWKARVLWVPNACEYNPPESANVVKSWGKVWPEIPECALKTVAHERLKAFCEGLGKGYAEAYAQSCLTLPAHPSPNQEQEQEQDIELPNGSSCSEPQAASEPAVLVFPAVGNPKTWDLTQSHIDRLTGTFTGVDVPAECRKAWQWSHDNAAKRKTAKGMPQFLYRWMSKAQNAGGRQQPPAKQAVKSWLDRQQEKEQANASQ